MKKREEASHDAEEVEAEETVANDDSKEKPSEITETAIPLGPHTEAIIIQGID